MLNVNLIAFELFHIGRFRVKKWSRTSGLVSRSDGLGGQKQIWQQSLKSLFFGVFDVFDTRERKLKFLERYEQV